MSMHVVAVLCVVEMFYAIANFCNFCLVQYQHNEMLQCCIQLYNCLYILVNVVAIAMLQCCIL